MKDEIKEILELYKNDDIEYYNLVSDLGYDKLLDYITTLQERIDKQDFLLKEQGKELKELYARIDKAIEHINKNKKTLTKQTVDFYNNDELAKGKLKIGTFMWHVDELLDILQGDDNND